MSYLSFKLNEDFVQSYKDVTPPWGFTDVAGNSVSEIIFVRTYSRMKEDGTKEKWFEVCRRVIEGMYSIQKDFAKQNRIPWNDNKAQKSAQEAFDRMFNFKWTPPGRGLWAMGTPLVNRDKNSAPLQNCAFISTHDMTKHDPGDVFAWLMEASMLGIGVGFDVRGAEKNFTITEPPVDTNAHVIPDTREGWCEAVKTVINAYLVPEKKMPVEFDFSQIRPEGEPIKTFGGTASGPEPLKKLLESIDKLLSNKCGSYLDTLTIMDIMNMIGVCVVAGNVRRTAELALGSVDDMDFINAKNYADNSYRAEWGWMSNNSVAVNVGDDLSGIVDNIAINGEPGIVWMDVTRDYGRLIDPPNYKDYRAAGYNPCAEQSLESHEMCTLAETYICNHDSVEDYERTLKFAYLYAKTVTLMPTHWEETNAVMKRNRRIGTSMSDIANFVDIHGVPALRNIQDKGYKAIQYYDRLYSEWLGIRESIKTTTVKPSGTVSLLAGASPGVHWPPGDTYHKRGVVFRAKDPMVEEFRKAGYNVKPYAYDEEGSVFIQFLIRSKAVRSEKDVSVFEKIHLASVAQKYWSDNSVSVTISYDPEKEGQYIPKIIAMYEGSLKTVSFLPMGNEVYPDMPYQSSSEEEYMDFDGKLDPVNMELIYKGKALDAEGESFCNTDKCEIPQKGDNA